MTGHDIITAFGGLDAMASLVGTNPNVVRQWRGIGIPAKYWHVLVDEARRRRIKGVTFEVLKGTKPERVG